MTTRRMSLIALGAGALAPRISSSQQPASMPTVGILGTNAEGRLTGLRAGLLALGYVEGRNLRLLERSGGERYERVAEVINEFMRLKVNVIVTIGTTAAQAAAKATSTIPIVMTSGADPVKAGLAASLARPGGNLTGMSQFLQELTAKRMQLAIEAFPGAHQVGVLWNPNSPASTAALAEAKAAAKALNLRLHLVEAREAADIDKALDTLRKARVDIAMPLSSNMLVDNRKLLLASANKYLLATVCDSLEWGEAGALIAYGVNQRELYFHLATHIDKILKGAKPGDLPIEQPTTFDFVVNLKTAKALGIKVPQTILLQATRVIE